MTTATAHSTLAAPTPLEIRGPVAHVPTLAELYLLTEVPDQRVVFRGVEWAFYEELADSIPEGSNIHVDYDGRDLEIMSLGRRHGKRNKLLGQLVEVIAQEFSIPYSSLADTTLKRRETTRGLQSDQCYYFLPEKLAADAEALGRDSDDIADYPNPDLAIEVDLSRPQVDRAEIYAALRVTEVWRLDVDDLIIERLTDEGNYVAVDSSGFLPIQAKEVRRWVVEEDATDESAWARRLRDEMKKKARRLARVARRHGEAK
jgi:Uma2 family endonuclease